LETLGELVLHGVDPLPHYQTHGRYQDEAGAREMDVDMVGILKELGMETIVAEPTEVATKQLFARLERWRKCPEIRWGSQLLDLVL
jgi:hypothetical protein